MSYLILNVHGETDASHAQRVNLAHVVRYAASGRSTNVWLTDGGVLRVAHPVETIDEALQEMGTGVEAVVVA